MNEIYERLKNYVEFIVNDQKIMSYAKQYEEGEEDLKVYFKDLCKIEEEDIEDIAFLLYYADDEIPQTRIFLSKELMDPELYGYVVDLICEYIHNELE